MLPVIESIVLRQMASGDRLYLQLYKFIGAQPGKSVSHLLLVICHLELGSF